MTADSSKERHNPQKGRAADGFVMMAMAVVTLALCMGLVAQVGLSFWLAVTVSAAFYMGLLTLHALVRRHDQLDDLRTEVDRLTGEVARLNQVGGLAGGVSQAMIAHGVPGRAPPRAAQMQAPPAVAPPTVSPPAAPIEDSLARVAAAMPPAAKVSGETDRSRPAEPSLTSQSEAKAGAVPVTDNFDYGLAGAFATGEPRDAAAQQMQKIVRAPMTPGLRPQIAEGGSLDLELPMRSGTAPESEPAASTSMPPIGGINRTRRNMAAGAPSIGDRKEPAARPARFDAKPGGLDSEQPRLTPVVRSGETEQKSMDAVAARMSGSPSNESDTSATPASVLGGEDASALPFEPPVTAAWSYRPGDDAREPGFSPSESDVEMIQGLIKKLADEVNSADAQKLSSGRSRESLDADALDRSVGALRQAARNMHEPLSNARGSRAARPAALPDTAPASDKVTEASPRHTPSATATVTPPVAPAMPAGPDLDVEALMRRAQPIATMTSMPPPLPAAPNVMDKRATPAVPAASDAPPVQVPLAVEPHGAADADAESVADDIWNSVGNEAVAGETSSHDELGARVARIADALAAGRVDVFLEPILDLEKQQARHFEVSVRLRDETGAEISPDDAAEAERPSGIMPLLDSVRLQRTAHVARRLEERNKHGNVFSTFSGQSLTADDFLSTFAETYESQVQLAGQLVLTFSQADARRFRTPHWTMINEMRDLGFGFALRAVTDLDMDFEMFAKAGFTFVKLDADVFLSGLPAPGALVPAADLCKHLEDLGLMPVVEAIDDDTKREQVFAHGVRLGQGRLFGGARQIKTPATSGRHPAAA